MYDATNNIEEKERKLARYLETHSTEEVIKEVQECNPTLYVHSDILCKLNKMKLTQPVLNTLIFYVLVTNKQKLVTYKLFALGDLCRKFNIKNAHSAINFFKQYYSYNNHISQKGVKAILP
jgi:replication initiation and membrane attachment protein DnaB